MAARNWTPEQRKQQAKVMRAWSPWLKSSGPRTLEGKAVASRNAWKGGTRALLREIALTIAAQGATLSAPALPA